MGLFVTFEGPEGSGKTTQIQRLHQALAVRGLPVLCTREPGGTPIGEQIRNVLHDLKNTDILPATEALLYSAARAQHVEQVLRPAIAQGRIVLCDRYAESTLAYQGYGHGLDLENLRQVTHLATGDLRPDLVIYLDLEVSVGLQRKLRDRDAGRGEWNRMDQQTIDFHRRVRDGYLRMAKENADRWLILDATQPVDTVHQLIYSRIEALLASLATA